MYELKRFFQKQKFEKNKINVTYSLHKYHHLSRQNKLKIRHRSTDLYV